MPTEPHTDLLARLDERTARIEIDVQAIRADLRRHYVTRDQFAPVRSLVYGFVGLVLVLVSTALVSAIVTP
jgi:hypothetical protein